MLQDHPPQCQKNPLYIVENGPLLRVERPPKYSCELDSRPPEQQFSGSIYTVSKRFPNGFPMIFDDRAHRTIHKPTRTKTNPLGSFYLDRRLGFFGIYLLVNFRLTVNSAGAIVTIVKSGTPPSKEYRNEN